MGTFDENLDDIKNKGYGEDVIAAIVSCLTFLKAVYYQEADITSEITTIMSDPDGKKIRIAIRDALLKLGEIESEPELAINEMTQEEYDSLDNVDPETIYGIRDPSKVYAVVLDDEYAQTDEVYMFDNAAECKDFFDTSSDVEDKPYAVRGNLSAVEELFMNDTNIIEFVCGDETRDILDRTFKNCSNLSNVVLGNLVHGIGSEAFANTNIASIKIPHSVGGIYNDAFNGCNNLVSIVIDSVEGSISGAPWGATNATISWRKDSD